MEKVFLPEHLHFYEFHRLGMVQVGGVAFIGVQMDLHFELGADPDDSVFERGAAWAGMHP